MTGRTIPDDSAARARIVRREIRGDLPSASAVEIIGEFIFLIGDDSPWLYLLDRDWNLVRTVKLFDGAVVNGRIPKADKPDLEMLARVPWQGRDELVIFGSGSKSPQRDVAFRVDVTDPSAPTNLRAVSMAGVYDQLRANPSVIGSGKLNLEAAAATDDEVLLFQRGNISRLHTVARFPLDAFMQFLDGTGSAPEPLVCSYALPMVETLHAGFSGAMALPGVEGILFCAAVEDTPNEIDDGDPVASFVGQIELGNGAEMAPQWTAVVRDGAEIYRGKIEGVSVLERQPRAFELLCATDDDKGGSELLAVRVDLNP